VATPATETAVEDILGGAGKTVFLNGERIYMDGKLRSHMRDDAYCTAVHRAAKINFPDPSKTLYLKVAGIFNG
jgi:hypothetical protein